MTEDQKKEIAMFRHAVIHDFIACKMNRAEKRKLLAAKTNKVWEIPYSNKTSISKNTIWRWIRIYEGSGRDIRSLFPNSRKDIGIQRALDEETVAFILNLKKDYPSLSIPKLIELIEEKYPNYPTGYLSPSTIYRILHSHGLMVESQAQIDRRRFEVATPNELWQADVMHGPKVHVNGRNRKTYLIAFIDDHSRFIVGAQFFLNENVTCFLECFREALQRRGIPQKLYVDNGSAFKSKRTKWVCASLNISLVHAKPYAPQGKGKIERFFKTLRADLLSLLQPVDLISLNAALDDWLHSNYHNNIHSSTREAPRERFLQAVDQITSAPKNLELHFRIKARRKVTKDRVVQLNKLLFEAPTSLIQKQVELLYLPEKPEEVELFFQNKSYGFLRKLDKIINANVGREITPKNSKIDHESNLDYEVSGQLSFS